MVVKSTMKPRSATKISCLANLFADLPLHVILCDKGVEEGVGGRKALDRIKLQHTIQQVHQMQRLLKFVIAHTL